MARDCAQAWDPTPPAVSTDIRTDVDESSVSDSGTIIADEPSVVPDPIPMTDSFEPSVLDKSPVDHVVKVSGKSSVADPVQVMDKSSDVPMPATVLDKSPAD